MSDDLLSVLSELAPKASFYNARQKSSLTADQYRQSWKTMPEPELSSVRLMEQNSADRLVEPMKSLLAPFMVVDENGEDCVFTSIEAILTGTETFVAPLYDFAEAVLTSAVLITPSRTVQLLRSWVDGEPIRCTSFTVLAGIVLEEDMMEAGPGVTLRRLPTDPDSLQKNGVPQRLIDAHTSRGGGGQWEPDIRGQPVLCTDDKFTPAFHTGGVSRHNPPMGISPQPPFGPHWPRALSLACDSAVGSTCGWARFDDDTCSFSPPARYWPHHTSVWSLDRRRPGIIWPRLTKEMVEKGRLLGTNLHKNGWGNRLIIAIDRWMNSKRDRLPNEFIDLRIAFEVLYAPDGNQGEISFRLQTRCARHLETSLEKRKSLAKTVRDFYNTSSAYAHGGQVSAGTKSKKDLERLSKAQQVCRRALIQIIESEGCADPDVEALSLS